MQRALVIKTYGNPELARGLAATMESTELKRLRAQIGVTNYARNEDYQKKIQEFIKSHPIRQISPFKKKLWGLYGLIVLLANQKE